MYGNQGVQRYRETDISSMSSEKMIVLLYERVVNDLESARKALATEDRVDFAKQINHSQRIISELRSALDHEVGGEIAQNLENLYGFMFHEHLEILLDRDETHIDNCLKVLTPLLEAWRKIPNGTGLQAARERTMNQTGANSARNAADEGAGQRQDTGLASETGQKSLLSVSV